MKTKMLVILFALISVVTAHASDRLPAQQNTSIMPTYALWCVYNNHASLWRVKWELRWACNNGADCSQMETGGHCQDLNYYSDQASYTFNDYYQKNPTPSNCVFDGTAVLTIQNPSTPTCNFPSNSNGPFPLTSSVTKTAAQNLGSFLWGLGFTYLAYVAAQIA